jgi:hypothetical protein
MLSGSAAQALVIDGCPDGDAAGTNWALGPYSAYRIGPGFMKYGAMEMATGDILEIVEYCPEQRQFVWNRGQFGSGDPLDMDADLLFDRMLEGDEGYTLTEMAEAMRAIGENAEVRQVGYISCACQQELGLAEGGQ